MDDAYFGRGRRLRTLGLRFWRPPLYQLSYSPMNILSELFPYIIRRLSYSPIYFCCYVSVDHLGLFFI